MLACRGCLDFIILSFAFVFIWTVFLRCCLVCLNMLDQFMVLYYFGNHVGQTDHFYDFSSPGFVFNQILIHNSELFGFDSMAARFFLCQFAYASVVGCLIIAPSLTFR